MFQPIILAGGNGTRLWPESRELHPKQYLNLFGAHSLLQDTLLRFKQLNASEPILICNEEHRFLVAEQLRQINYQNCSILLEPFGRSTAPAIALAAFQASLQNEDPILLVLPSDHRIEDVDSLSTVLKLAINIAAQNKMITFGVTPTYPETGYGYIQKGTCLESNAYIVEKFIEKPDRNKAIELLQGKNYLWNSGMFMFKASVYLNELKRLNPDVFSTCKNAFEKRKKDMDFIRINANAFELCPNISVDYGVMEKTSEVVTIEIDAGWNDIGSWSAVWETNQKDEEGNVKVGDVFAYNTQNCLLRSEHRLIATVGIDNIVVIETVDAILIADKEKTQDVKEIVSELKKKNRMEYRNHRKVCRPWGIYDSIDSGNRHQVKRITVDPGKKLSVQMHFHRAEHWVVVKGTAKVTNGDKTYLVSENESTYIPIGQIHALENPGKIPLELIEVQSGPYLGEDDIVRFEDLYGRIPEKETNDFANVTDNK